MWSYNDTANQSNLTFLSLCPSGEPVHPAVCGVCPTQPGWIHPMLSGSTAGFHHDELPAGKRHTHAHAE